MISFRGRSNLVKYESNKPTKYGFRPYVLADAIDGYTYEFYLCDEIQKKENLTKN